MRKGPGMLVRIAIWKQSGTPLPLTLISLDELDAKHCWHAQRTGV